MLTQGFLEMCHGCQGRSGRLLMRASGITSSYDSFKSYVIRIFFYSEAASSEGSRLPELSPYSLRARAVWLYSVTCSRRRRIRGFATVWSPGYLDHGPISWQCSQVIVLAEHAFNSSPWHPIEEESVAHSKELLTASSFVLPSFLHETESFYNKLNMFKCRVDSF